MSDYLPSIVIPDKEPEPEPEPEPEEEEEEVKELVKKPKVSLDRIFQTPKVEKIKDPSDDEDESEEEIIIKKKPKKRQTIKYVTDSDDEEMVEEAKVEPIRKRRPQTERQKEALRKGREKSLATRRRKKEIKNTVSVKKVNEENEIIDKKVDKDELQDLMLKTIMGYDAQKKEMKAKRKVEKEAEDKIRKREEAVTNQIKRAINPSNDDYWGECFNITY
tara:strand:- start:184 stop:840 length:657 start_codon:yes stop_codon:yes gene_type:complete